MTVRAATIACLCVAGWAVAANAQDTIEPDRPDVTNGAHLLGPGRLQFEIGGLYARGASSERAFASPFTVRIGLTEWIEARAGADGLLTQTDAGNRATGFGNVQLAAKLRLWAGPDGVAVLSVLPGVTLPTASADKRLGSGAADYTLAVLTGADVGRRWHVDVNYGVAGIGEPVHASRFPQHLVSVSASASASDHWNPYGEAFWYSRQEAGGSGVTAFDTGVIYTVSARSALDAGIQIGISERTVAAFGGFSIRVGPGKARPPSARHLRP